MASCNQFLNEDDINQLEKAGKLNDEDSKSDPEDNPFKSKYEAREIWQSIRSKLKDLLNENDYTRIRNTISVLDLKLGINYVETEEPRTGEEYLNKCLEAVKDSGMDDKSCNIYQCVLNYLGILWSMRQDLSQSRDWLIKAEDLYKTYKETVDISPVAVDEYLTLVTDNADKLEYFRVRCFENAYTHTLYYLAQAYATLEENKKSAHYCHITLQRQLEYQVYEPADWAINAATLSQYYLNIDNFKLARHCLAAAMVIFQEVEGESPEELEINSQKKADIERCWAKYGLMLLESSTDKLLQEIENIQLDDAAANVPNHNDDKTACAENAEPESNTEDIPSDAHEDADGKEVSKLYFSLEVTKYEEQIADQLLLNFSEARSVFLWIKTWLDASTEFYALDGHCVDYVEIVQDKSKAFKLLSFFELDLDRQCKMHKRRVDMLFAVLNELNPQFYLLICRQLMYEIAETYSTMVDLKLANIEANSERPSPHAITKLNHLVNQSIDQYQVYLNSIKGNKPEYPEFSDSDIRPALVAFFCMGRLYSKLVCPEVADRLKYINKTLDCYKFIVDYCEKYPNTADVMDSELGVCREMIELLPLKMERIRETSAM